MNRELPEDFVLYSEWPEYVEDAFFPAWMNATRVGESPRGWRNKTIGFHQERYASDLEPVLHSNPKLSSGRLVIWQRLQRRDIPEGWSESYVLDILFGTKRPYFEAVILLYGDERDVAQWSRTLRNELYQWRKRFIAGDYLMEVVSYAVFLDAYLQSLTWHKLPAFEKETILARISLMSKRGYSVQFRLLRDAASKAVLAGMATIDSVEYRSSYYFLGFLCAAGSKQQSMIGLIYDWFQHSTEKKFMTLQLGKIWTPACGSTWKYRKGYSEFKEKLNPIQITFPSALYRYVPRATKGPLQ